MDPMTLTDWQYSRSYPPLPATTLASTFRQLLFNQSAVSTPKSELRMSVKFPAKHRLYSNSGNYFFSNESADIWLSERWETKDEREETKYKNSKQSSFNKPIFITPYMYIYILET